MKDTSDLQVNLIELDEQWEMAELLQAVLESSDVPPVRPTTLRPGHTPFRPRVIQGSKQLKPR